MSNMSPQQELVESLSDQQRKMMRALMYTLAMVWGVIKPTLTPRQKELITLIGEEHEQTLKAAKEKFSD
jgi:hypothetical protein